MNEAANSESDFAAIRAELESKLNELLTRASDVDDKLSETPNSDWEENAVDSEQDEVLDHIGQAAMEEIAEIRFALSRLDNGTYGICSSCGGTIPVERLEALPFSSHCIQCSSAGRF